MTMILNKRTGLVAGTTVAALLVAAGCSSGSSGGGAGSPTGATQPGLQTVTVGLLTDMTGPAASGNKTSVAGVHAGAVSAARNGYRVKFVVGDTASSPATAVSAARQLVTQDHADVIIANSALTSLAAPYLTSRHVPVIGFSEDGPEWVTAKNMFAFSGVIHTEKVATTYGVFFSSQGVTNLGALGYGVSPVSGEFAKSVAESAKNAGLKTGYVNSTFPFGSTNVAPIAIAMKQAGVDAFAASVDPNTAFSLITALRDNGVSLKVALLPTGYGGDLNQAGAGALAAAQNVYFMLGQEPMEMHTAAAQQFQRDLTSAGVRGEATTSMYNGYLSTGPLVKALKLAGPKPSQADIITALTSIHSYDGLGLWGGRNANPTTATTSSPAWTIASGWSSW